MKKLFKKDESGFTIIEVVLVLAIAGLIFLVVFLALPQLQRSQRDSARRSDVGRLIAGINSFTTNNNGDIPADAEEVEMEVIDNFVENWDYTIVASDGESEDAVAFVSGGQCSEDNRAVEGGSSRQFAVSIQLEAGNEVYYCAEG